MLLECSLHPNTVQIHDEVAVQEQIISRYFNIFPYYELLIPTLYGGALPVFYGCITIWNLGLKGKATT
ncbi:Hypothetical predicted protein [Mytilus galloprovincialis]|uniref:Uncharacterized protein n=1 Tax=Mytilus galloprovincialis TaxID=29158 RepID=A0A8B6D493_MYTGA|nr:Hypothetical predicted protein [Mytilus galloprovincialis]